MGIKCLVMAILGDAAMNIGQMIIIKISCKCSEKYISFFIYNVLAVSGYMMHVLCLDKDDKIEILKLFLKFMKIFFFRKNYE
jgi:hypothetical protein